MSNQTSKLALAKLRRRHAALFDFPSAENTDPWLEALELARHRVEALKALFRRVRSFGEAIRFRGFKRTGAGGLGASAGAIQTAPTCQKPVIHRREKLTGSFHAIWRRALVRAFTIR
jgi:hypothetical protein